MDHKPTVQFSKEGHSPRQSLQRLVMSFDCHSRYLSTLNLIPKCLKFHSLRHRNFAEFIAHLRSSSHLPCSWTCLDWLSSSILTCLEAPTVGIFSSFWLWSSFAALFDLIEVFVLLPSSNLVFKLHLSRVVSAQVCG